jgi:hypothetical protein
VTVSVPSTAFARSASSTPGVLPPWAHAFGASYSQWSAAWWQWALEQPDVPSSPVVDPNPGTASQPEAVDCTLGQSGKVWFLAGTTSIQPDSATYRSCNVPTGVALFFPVIDTWQDNLDCVTQPPFTLTGSQLRQAVQQQTDTIVPGSMSVTVDGRTVQGLSNSSTDYRAAADGFSYTLPANNWVSLLCSGYPAFPAGTTPPPPGAYADGVYLLLAPLSPGTHHISFEGAESGTSQDVSYTITVSR